MREVVSLLRIRYPVPLIPWWSCLEERSLHLAQWNHMVPLGFLTALQLLYRLLYLMGKEDYATIEKACLLLLPYLAEVRSSQTKTFCGT